MGDVWNNNTFLRLFILLQVRVEIKGFVTQWLLHYIYVFMFLSKAFGIGTIDVIVLRFPTIWWPQEVYGFGIVWLNEDKDMSDVSNNRGHFYTRHLL